MKKTNSRQIQTGFVATLGLALVAVMLLAVSVQADNTIQVNMGEAVVLSSEGYSKVAVADPAIADVAPLSEKELSVIGKKGGTTTLTVVQPDNKPTVVYRIEVVNDAAVRTIIKLIAQPNVTVSTVGESIVLEGQVADELEAQRVLQVASAYKMPVVNLIEIQKPRQIRIRTKVAEVNSDAVRGVGFKWFGPQGETQFAVDWNKGTGWLMGMTQPQSSSGVSPTAPNAIDVGAEVILQMLETKGYARLLAEPTLVTYSGQEASFLVGQEYPIVQQLPQSFNVTYKEIGIRMNIKPTSDSHNRISTKIHSEVSQIAGLEPRFSTPIIGTKKAEATLQVNDGQTIVIGGLLENNIDRDILRKVPWMADIPVLGILFRHKDSQKTQREVMFFMTPEVVKDVDAETKDAAQSALMKEWLKGFNPKDVLVIPNPKKDWSLANPGAMGWPESNEGATCASKSVKTGAEQPAPSPSKEPNTNFVPARPAVQ